MKSVDLSNSSDTRNLHDDQFTDEMVVGCEHGSVRLLEALGAPSTHRLLRAAASCISDSDLAP